MGSDCSPRLLLTAPQLTGHGSYVLITPIHADKKQQKVKPRRTGFNCFESKSPEKFALILHDLRHGALMHEVTAHYKVPQSTVVALRRHYKDLLPVFDRGASRRVEVTRKAEMDRALDMLKGGAIYAEVEAETGLEERTVRRLRNACRSNCPETVLPPRRGPSFANEGSNKQPCCLLGGRGGANLGHWEKNLEPHSSPEKIYKGRSLVLPALYLGQFSRRRSKALRKI